MRCVPEMMADDDGSDPLAANIALAPCRGYRYPLPMLAAKMLLLPGPVAARLPLPVPPSRLPLLPKMLLLPPTREDPCGRA